MPGTPEEGAEAAVSTPPPAEGEEQPEETKLYESRHCFVNIKLTLSEPINPTVDPNVLPKSSNISMNAVKNIP